MYRPLPKQLTIKNSSIEGLGIYANEDIKKGDLLTEKNITVKRPGNGINPMKWDEVIGSIALKNYNADELI